MLSMSFAPSSLRSWFKVHAPVRFGTLSRSVASDCAQTLAAAAAVDKTTASAPSKRKETLYMCFLCLPGGQALRPDDVHSVGVARVSVISEP
jgi:hypothetical protein